jgi:hypothetical protein
MRENSAISHKTIREARLFHLMQSKLTQGPITAALVRMRGYQRMRNDQSLTLMSSMLLPG